MPCVSTFLNKLAMCCKTHRMLNHPTPHSTFSVAHYTFDYSNRCTAFHPTINIFIDASRNHTGARTQTPHLSPANRALRCTALHLRTRPAVRARHDQYYCTVVVLCHQHTVSPSMIFEAGFVSLSSPPHVNFFYFSITSASAAAYIIQLTVTSGLPMSTFSLPVNITISYLIILEFIF
jgi:hypothetical protein